MNLLAVLLIGAFASPEVPGTGIGRPQAADRFKIDFKAGLSEKQGKWVFAVDGFTDLPAETVLRARVYVLDLVNDPVRGPREDDEEGLLREDELMQSAFTRFTAGGGWFHVDVHQFVRKPYSIRYRTKIHYFPEDQTEPVRLKVGDQPFFRKADLRAGTEADYAAELKERLGEATKHLAALERLGLELRDRAFGQAWNAAAWDAWKTETLAAIDGIRDENRHRYKIWGVYIEGQASMRVGALCEFLQHCIGAVDDGVRTREPERLRRLLHGFLESVEEACDVLGADVPVHPQRAGPVLKAYERSLAALRESGSSAAALKQAHAEAIASLFELTSMLRIRRRGYVRLNAVAVHLVRVYDLRTAKAPAEDLRAALREHDAAVLEFKSFARIP